MHLHAPVTRGVGAPLLPALAHTGVCTCVRQPVFPCADRLDDVVGAWEHAPTSRPNMQLHASAYHLCRLFVYSGAFPPRCVGAWALITFSPQVRS